MTGPLIAPDALAAQLGDPDLVILDIRSVVDGGGRAAYEAGHVPGAIHTDYVAGGWRVKDPGGGAGMLPDDADLAALLGGLGIAPRSHVVVAPAGVSPGDFAAAARVYWTLKVAGHDRLSMLDGGTAAWTRSGHPLETDLRAPHSAPPYPVARRDAFRAVLPQVERALAEGSATLVDTRNDASFAGEEKSPVAARAGRIPGSLQQEGARAYDRAANRLRPPAELEAAFPVPDGEVIAYCNTGQQAATNWFVLSEVLGRPAIRLYDGSLSEWTNDPSRPVETGRAATD
ncbi:sulfurtransferase [Enterovirga rhinocerotis]|uniref:Thiosulfate/3-mercaptopyruvate sulfurtransferase n=1 Tax=Enterovirga rhinocerotis TaxID=1339210 RepID=A0A4R7BYQ3_9HYPH|nr:sulfurtransferase [Enterovirga rhinocerotis]TDR90392.1 thiosulfate/3-mercaptopyruvate sulfurtransferase [Enterovirga rhinocerotis]